MEKPLHDSQAARNDQPQSKSSYVVDAENAAEMARLTRQARMLSQHFALFPCDIALPEAPRILDIGCGPGEWAHSVAKHLPQSQVFGIDISDLMITYARYMASSEDISNTNFQVMDARQPLAFPDAYFDYVNARFIVGILSTSQWGPLLRECFRVLRPGGLICDIEPESFGSTTGDALGRYSLFLTQASRCAGKAFTSFGEMVGISAVQPRLLREAGFHQVQQGAYIINYSAGMPAHDAIYDNFKTFMKLLQPFIIAQNLSTQEELERLYAQALEEMEDNEFCAAAFFSRVCAKKPV
ncbi:class I SAM-dependent methyltransferase [Ktedonosporobacter rubrisoli]|nr:class I SAM-dependent methyltransferase [Ktedonosporobacter rubrisoli]